MCTALSCLGLLRIPENILLLSRKQGGAGMGGLWSNEMVLVTGYATVHCCIHTMAVGADLLV
tara:strand:- start:1 stop:186 length:186 start_codon:yes stop_codon:yes gene_type:complete